MKLSLPLFWLLLLSISAQAQQADADRKLRELESKLNQATTQLQELGGVVESLRKEISKFKGEKVRDAKQNHSTLNTAPIPAESAEKSQGKRVAEEFVERIMDPELGGSERDHEIEAKPEIFIQARYSAAPIRNVGAAFEPNLSLTRIETRWAGKVTDKLGAGLEIQFHPAIDGSPEELVNDAFIEYYLNDSATLRAGQFIKPFGFDIQQSSGARESPERGIFAGYFFPGQRDRGVMLFGNLDFFKADGLRNTHYFVGAFNGNRFFTDNNRQMNYVARVRKLFANPNLAIGFSMQAGKQILPDGFSGNNDENLIGADFQYAKGRFGVRGEFVAGNMPSTLLAIEPEFASAFRPGAHASGGHLFATYRLNDRDNFYARYDQFNGDPVTGMNVRAFNIGYFRSIGEQSRLSFDYQFKKRPSFNDDALNGRLHITWNLEF